MVGNLFKILANRLEHSIGVEMFTYGYLGFGGKICKCFNRVSFFRDFMAISYVYN